MKKTEFYADLARPYGYTRGLFGYLGRLGATRTSVISINRSDRIPEFNAQDALLLSTLVPHVQRALQIHRRLVSAEQQRSAMADLMERLRTGVVLLDVSRRPVLVNRAANDILDQRDGLSLSNGELRAGTPGLTAQVRSAIVAAVDVSSGRSVVAGDSALSIPRPSGRRPFQLLITPLSRANDWTGAIGQAVAAVFVADPERDTQPEESRLRQWYGLTPAEARVATALAAAQTVNEIADGLGLTRETVRWYVKTVLSKADVSTQAKFVHLVMTGLGRDSL
jgi:DNA-binding CsgD family transcriptional regulator